MSTGEKKEPFGVSFSAHANTPLLLLLLLWHHTQSGEALLHYAHKKEEEEEEEGVLLTLPAYDIRWTPRSGREKDGSSKITMRGLFRHHSTPRTV